VVLGTTFTRLPLLEALLLLTLVLLIASLLVEAVAGHGLAVVQAGTSKQHQLILLLERIPQRSGLVALQKLSAAHQF
jgi:hypothetical protein